eukprot:augustus_masked-scaffold_84-processed-gene-0.31-mRNA-1 protein AED:0.39 eAED:0.39 QI:0/-1/0/1/-1/1/1/0/702
MEDVLKKYVLGIDFGSDSIVVSFLSLDKMKPEILRNDVSNQSTPNAILFQNKQRFFGQSPTTAENGVKNILRLIQEGSLTKIKYGSETVEVSSEQFLAMFLKKLISYAVKSEVHQTLNIKPDEILCAFIIPESFGEDQKKRVLRAAKLAEVDLSADNILTRTEAAAVCNGTKKRIELNQAVMYIDIGHIFSSFSVFVHNEEENKISTRHLASEVSADSASKKVDDIIYKILCGKIEQTHDEKILEGSKSSSRLRKAVTKLKEILSGVAIGKTTVENLFDGKDITLTISREEVETDPEIKTISDNILQSIKAAYDGLRDKEVEKLTAEIIGGGARSWFIKSAIEEALAACGEGLVPAYTLDSLAAGSIGAAYHAAKKLEPTGATRKPIFDEISLLLEHNALLDVTFEHIEEEAVLIAEMDEFDELIVNAAAARNDLESYIYEWKATANSNRDFTDLIKREEALGTLVEAQDWLDDWDYSEEIRTKYQEYHQLREKLVALKTDLKPMINEYLEKLDEVKRKKEEELKKLSEQDAKERANDPQDHDFRKLPKKERMKKVMMNKDEGTGLFKDGNIEPASLRYKRALQHCEKFFDLNPDDEKEVEDVKCTLHLNLAMCSMKLDDNKKALEYLDLVVEVKPENLKALYRKGLVLGKLKRYKEAKKTLNTALKVEPEDKACLGLMKKIDLYIQREKAKERKFAQRMFS